AINPLLYRFAPSHALNTRELAVILTMTLIACGVPSQGQMRSFIPTLVAPFFHGRSNQQFWNAFVGMKLPHWMFPVPSDLDGRSSSIVSDFYGRIPEGTPIPYSAWIVPLLGWGVFIAGMFMTFIALAWLLRVQWGQNERLPFPMAQLQLSLIEPPEKGRYLNKLFRSPGFWIALV